MVLVCWRFEIIIANKKKMNMSVEFSVSKVAICIVNILLMVTALAGQNKDDFSFNPKTKEYNAFEYFDADTIGVHPVNTFLLAKLSELMYLERIDYQLKYLQNGYKTVDSIPSSAWIKEYPKVRDDNFKMAFESRFQHFFYDPSEMPLRNLEPNNGMQVSSTPSFDYCYWLDSINWAAENIPEFHFIHKTAYWDNKKKQGLDPELVVISTQDLVIIVFRGTDKVGNDDWSEWKGTDFKLGLVPAGGSLMKTKVHKGFWQSFELIRDELIRTLEQVDASKKKVWLTGHSLGGAMAILSGTYLKSIGYPVQNVYAFAAPRVVGNAGFVKRMNELLPNQVQRFEYYLDPIALLWAPKYRHAGQRNWFDEAERGNYKLYTNIKERYISPWFFRFNRHPFKDKRTKSEIRLQRTQFNGMIPELAFRFWYHNPQWYVKAAYQQLSDAQKAMLPDVDDSFPYLYDSAKGPMTGSK
jgi:triacylglycerol lipase